MTEVLSFGPTKIFDVAVTAHCRDCASTFMLNVTTDQHDTHVNMRSLLVYCEPRANVLCLQCDTHINSRHKQRRPRHTYFIIGNISPVTIQSH